MFLTDCKFSEFHVHCDVGQQCHWTMLWKKWLPAIDATANCVIVYFNIVTRFLVSARLLNTTIIRSFRVFNEIKRAVLYACPFKVYACVCARALIEHSVYRFESCNEINLKPSSITCSRERHSFSSCKRCQKYYVHT